MPLDKSDSIKPPTMSAIDRNVCPRHASSLLCCSCILVKDEAGALIALTPEQRKEFRKTGKVSTKGIIHPLLRRTHARS